MITECSQIQTSYAVLTLSQKTNFRLSQTERICRMTILDSMKMMKNAPKG